MNELDSPYELFVATDDECEQVSDEIMHFNAKQVPFTTKPTPVFKRYVIKDNGVIVAGINAFVYHWGMLFIDELFVSEAYRKKRFASYLMKKVENEAKLIGATLAHTDTFDFQAKDFYLKQGYTVFGVLEDCPPGHKRYYLKKIL